MAMSCLSTISSIQTSKKVLVTTPYAFVFPTDLNNAVMSSYLYTHSAGSTSTSPYACFSYGSSAAYQTGLVGSANNVQYKYNTSNGTITTTNVVSYARAAYSSGNYINGGVANSNITTDDNLYNTYWGEFMQVIFPFAFILQQIYIAVPQSTNPTLCPQDTRIFGSNNGITWYQVGYVSYTTTYVSNTLTLVLNILATNTTAYTHHRFMWESNNTAGFVSLKTCVIEGTAMIVS